MDQVMLTQYFLWFTIYLLIQKEENFNLGPEFNNDKGLDCCATEAGPVNAITLKGHCHGDVVCCAKLLKYLRKNLFSNVRLILENLGLSKGISMRKLEQTIISF